MPAVQQPEAYQVPVKGMVASAHPLASEAGASILRQGGNAFDATVAVAATLNVVEPFMSGLAGQGLATAWVAAERRVRVLDFVPSIPRTFPAGRFHTREQLKRGPLAVGLPGNLAGWAMLRDTYGCLPWAQLLAPAIQHAEQGFHVLRFGAEEICRTGPGLGASAEFGATWLANYPFQNGIAVGDTVRQADLAGTFRQIATEGAQTLYRGPLGRRVAEHLASIGGTLTLEDLRDVQPVWRDPARVPFRGLLVHAPPPPCEGFQFLLSLRILDGFDIAACGANSAGHLDLVVRAIRLAAGVRISNQNPSTDRLAVLLSDSFVETLRARLCAGDGFSGATEQWMREAPVGEDPGHTTSFSVADAEGNLVCVTQSLGNPFGSAIVVPGTGMSLNNFLYWTDVQPDSPNRSVPGGPMPICMSPSISTRDGAPVLALGTPGSYGILQTQVQAMVHHQVFGLPIQDAISAPRGRLWDGSLVEFENRIDPVVIAALRVKGHDARVFETAYEMKVGGMQAIRLEPWTGQTAGAADPRRDGSIATA